MPSSRSVGESSTHFLPCGAKLILICNSNGQTLQVMTEAYNHGEDYEQENVHNVYEQIATHFSSTRYKVCILGSSPLPPSPGQAIPC